MPIPTPARRTAAAVAALSLFALAANAHADDAPPPGPSSSAPPAAIVPPPPASAPPAPALVAPPAPPPPADLFGLDVEAALFMSYSNAYKNADVPGSAPAIGLEISAAKHFGIFRAGAFADSETTFLGPSSVHIGALIGPSFRPVPWLRLGADAEVGANFINGIGNGLFVESVTGDTSAVLPFVGARAAVDLQLGPGGHGLLGIWGAVRQDLSTQTGRLEQNDCFLSCSVATESWKVGGTTAVVGVRGGYEF